MFCRKCGEQISEDAELCPICGEMQEVIEERTEKEEKGIVGKTAKVIGAIGVPLLTIAGQAFLDQTRPVVAKKAKKVTKNVLKNIGLKKKTPLDLAAEKVKKVMK